MSEWIDESAEKVRKHIEAVNERTAKIVATAELRKARIATDFPPLWDDMRGRVASMADSFNDRVGMKVVQVQSDARVLNVWAEFKSATYRVVYTIDQTNGAIGAREHEKASAGGSGESSPGVLVGVIIDDGALLLTLRGKPSTPEEVAESIARDAFKKIETAILRQVH
jgi:hypothetical protein